MLRTRIQFLVRKGVFAVWHPLTPLRLLLSSLPDWNVLLLCIFLPLVTVFIIIVTSNWSFRFLFLVLLIIIIQTIMKTIDTRLAVSAVGSTIPYYFKDQEVLLV